MPAFAGLLEWNESEIVTWEDFFQFRLGEILVINIDGDDSRFLAGDDGDIGLWKFRPELFHCREVIGRIE